MQKITGKRINNSELAPARIAEQQTRFRQQEALYVDLSTFNEGLEDVGDLLVDLNREKQKVDKEKDSIASQKINSIVDNEQTATFAKLEGMSLSDMQNNVGTLRENFSANIREKIKDIPMTSKMRQYVNDNFTALDERMKIKLDYQLKRRETKYVIDENLNNYNSALQTGNTDTALDLKNRLLDLGVNVKESEEDIKSRGTFVTLRNAIDLNNFNELDKLQKLTPDSPSKNTAETADAEAGSVSKNTAETADTEAGSVSKKSEKKSIYAHYPELKYEDRMRLIRYGKEKQAALQNENFNKYLNMAVEGNDFTIDEIKSMHEKGGLADSSYRSLILGKQEKNYENIVYELSNVDDDDKLDDNIAGYQRIIDSEFEAGNISEKQYNSLNSAIKSGNAKVQSARLGKELKNAKARNEYAVKSLKAEVLNMPILHANQIHLIRKRFIKSINEVTDDPDEVLKLLDFFDKNINNDPLEKSDQGRLAKAYINDLFKGYIESGEEDDKMVNAWKLDAYFVARQMHAKGASYQDIEKAINEAVKFAAEKDIPRLINRGMRLIKPATYGKSYGYSGKSEAEELLDIVGDGSQKWFNIPQKNNSKNIVRSYEGKDDFGNTVTYIDIKQNDGTVKTVIAEDYEEIK